MEVIHQCVATLSNAEVYHLLESEKLIEHKNTNTATVAYETIRHLEQMPCRYQTKEVIEDFLRALAPYDFTKAEKLQLLNLRPTSIVEIQLIVEELDERLKTEEELNKLINIIETKLPLGDKEGKEEQQKK